MNSVLRAENLKKSFDSKLVVDNASLKVAQGEVVGLLGPNGAGKTISFYMMVGLITVDAGKIFLDEEDITRNKIHLRAQKGIGYLPQEASVFRKLDVKDNILAILQTRKNLNVAERKSKLDSLLTEFNLNHVRDTLGMSLSGGERRRVEIARALAIEPKFILLDEPFAGVDPISVGEIQAMIEKLAAANVGILITDHNVRETLKICARSYILSSGKIIAKGSKDEILANSEVKDVYLGKGFRL